MRKRNVTFYLSALILCFATNIGFGQWTINGDDIYNTNSGNVGIGTTSPTHLIHAIKISGEPRITVHNSGGFGGASFGMIDDLSGANWKFKATTTGGFKIRDHANGLDVIVIEPNSSANSVYINSDGNLGIGTDLPESSAILDISSNTKGILVPRLTLAQRAGVSNPAEGLLIYQVDDIPGFYFYNGTDWVVIGNEYFSIDNLSDGISIGNSLFLGSGAGANDDGTTNNNVAVGENALNANTSGYNNLALGNQALASNTSGRHNIANGYQALFNNTTGDENTATGYQALYSNSEGDYNSAYGWQALNLNSLGHHNTGIGYGALQWNTQGHYNTAVGHNCLKQNSEGSHNTAVGFQPLGENNTGENNTALGSHSSYSNNYGNNNTSLGYYANYFNQEGSNNTILGYEAGMGTVLHNKSGNVFIGYQAGYNEAGDNKLYIENSDASDPLIYGEFDNDLIRVNGALDINGAYQMPTSDGTAGQFLQTDGSGNLIWSNAVGGATQIDELSDAISDGSSIFMGSGAGANDDGSSNQNVAMGLNALYANTSGYNNLALGNQALASNTSGRHNIANGYQALFNNTTGDENTATGYQALYSNSEGDYNSAYGWQALNLNSLGHHNTGIGYGALQWNTQGHYNTAVGHNCLKQNSEGSHNTAVGFQPLGENDTGEKNTALGSHSSYSNTYGNNNTSLGFYANYFNQEGSNNTILGYEAGMGTAVHNKSGNVFIGYQAGYNETGDNRLYIENSDASDPLIYGEFDNDRVTINDILRLPPQATVPSSPLDGEIYVNTDGHIYCYLGGTWKQLDN